MKNDILTVGLLMILTTVSIWSLFQQGLPPTHDGEYHVVRFYEFNKVLREGNLYPRWAPDLNSGYGIPLFNFVYPLPNYTASVFHFFGISFIDAFKLNMICASLIGAIFMFLWTRIFWGNLGGITASIFYTYSPYHLLDIYIRGSVGEVWTLGLLPALLWAVTKLIKENSLIFIPVSSIFLSLVIFSHNILALMFFPMIISYIALLIFHQQNKKYFLLNTFYLILFGLGLSSIFWLPALWERQFVTGLDVFSFRSHFVEPYQLIFPSWGSGFSADPTTQGLSFQIGIANLIALIVSIITMFFSQREERKKFYVCALFIFWTFLAVFLMLELSSILWNSIPFIQYFQFPWRFLSIIILSASFLAGSIIHFWKWKIVLVIFLLMPILLGLGYMKPAYYHLRDDDYYITRSNFIDGTNSPGNAFNTIWFNRSLEKKFISMERTGQIVRVNTAYFPGWQGFANGEKVKTEADKDGLIKLTVPEGEYQIELKFTDTPVRSFAKSLSAISLTAILLLFARTLHARMYYKA